MNLRLLVRFLACCVVTIMFGLLSACGGGGGGGNNNSAVVLATTKVAPADKIVSYSENGSIVFDGASAEAKTYKTGDVIVAATSTNTPMGLLRKVTSVQQLDGDTVFSTEQATLEDTFEELNLSVSQDIPIDTIATPKKLLKGASFKLAEKGIPPTIQLNRIEISPGIFIDGSISITPSYNFEIKIAKSKLSSLNFTYVMTEKVKLTATAEKELAVSKTVEVAKWGFGELPLITIWVGAVPIIFQPEISINVGIEGQVSVGLTCSVTQDATFTSGLNYAKPSWTPISSTTNSFDFTPPTANANASVKAFAGPEFALLLYGVTGPFVNPHAYLKYDRNLISTPQNTLYAGLAVDVGLKFDVIGTNISLSKEVTVIDYSKLLYPFNISGSVKLNGSGLSGVLISTAGASATTDSSGNYIIGDLKNGDYTLTPSKAGYTFTPLTNTATVNWGDISGKNFTATAKTYSISGQVTANGAGLSGVAVSTSGGSATTDSSGNYSISGLANGVYTVSAAKSGYTLSASQSVTVNNVNVTGKNFTATLIPTNFSISGQVTQNGAALSGVTVTLSGSGSNSTTTDASGNYTFAGAQNGTYTLSASKSGYTMSANQSVTVSNANVTGKNFTATLISTTFSISGQVTQNGAALSGVTVTLSGSGSNSTTTDASGNYTFTGAQNGNYTLSASKSGYTMSANQSVTVSNANVTGKNFTATAIPSTYSISGIVTLNGAALSGVTVTFTGSGSTSTTTDPGGNYSFSVAQNGSYTITPTLSGHAFTPASLTATVSGASVTGKNFTATNTGSITGSW